jgi:hypothetical protein
MSRSFFFIESHQDREGKSLDSWGSLEHHLRQYCQSLLELSCHIWTHSSQAKFGYWSNKHFFPPQRPTAINWDTINKAIYSLPFGQKRWLVKHVTGFCGVGKVMERCKDWDHSKCPCCNQLDKDPLDVLQSKDPCSCLQWAHSLDALSAWMKVKDTNPHIRIAVHA